MTPAVCVENLSKLYRLNAESRAGYNTLRDQLVSWVRRPFRRSASPEPFWALRDVSFEVPAGAVVGIIGRNGAGKSTLLKILSRITKPTSGRATIRGRVGSLLEVGTGFHPELTGRENVYLNGSILGMKRAEIDRRFAEIVAFAEVERFLDTPVKRYSSGMYVRLAFAVAAHTEPEVLIVDEVLAVGDSQFQSRCLAKMKSIAGSGRTVLLVSHQLSTVRQLCTFAIGLDHGRVARTGTAEAVVSGYLAETQLGTGAGGWIDLRALPRTGTGEVQFRELCYAGDADAEASAVYSGGPLVATVRLWSDSDRTVSSAALTVYDRFGTRLINASTDACSQSVALTKGDNEMSFRIDRLPLSPGNYVIGLWLANLDHVYDYLTEAAELEVQAPLVDPGRLLRWDGVVACDYRIEVAR